MQLQPHSQRKYFNIEANESINELDSLSATLLNNCIFKERANEKHPSVEISNVNELIKDIIPGANRNKDGTKMLKCVLNCDEIRNKEDEDFGIAIDHMISLSIIILIC